MTHRLDTNNNSKLSISSAAFQKSEVNSFTIDLKAKPKITSNGENNLKKTLLNISNSENVMPRSTEAQTCRNANRINIANIPVEVKQNAKISLFEKR